MLMIFFFCFFMSLFFMFFFFFFFSSRRRHTRFDCDWSSDVCSSDLRLLLALLLLARAGTHGERGLRRRDAQARLRRGAGAAGLDLELLEVLGQLLVLAEDGHLGGGAALDALRQDVGAVGEQEVGELAV